MNLGNSFFAEDLGVFLAWIFILCCKHIFLDITGVFLMDSWDFLGFFNFLRFSCSAADFLLTMLLYVRCVALIEAKRTKGRWVLFACLRNWNELRF